MQNFKSFGPLETELQAPPCPRTQTLLSPFVNVLIISISVTGTSGTFNSVNYPSNYFDDYEEQYIISVEDGSKISFYFEVFDLEYHVGCIYDYIKGNASNC